MIQQISVNDENRVKIGKTFPRRAKQLVNKNRARWIDHTHTEIMLMPSKMEGKQMAAETINMEESPPDAKSVLELGEIRKKSIIKDVYRDEVDLILSSLPFDIIKKSKRRTRELNIAFSIVLWSGAAIFYIVLNYFLGNRTFTFAPAEISSTWLIFIFAALIECMVEIFFCKKELAVLNENIDLRQINPARAKDGDLDLRKYQKSLTRKIRVMTSAVMWIPLTLIFFAGGYIFNLWNVLWVIFLFGLFVEFLFNFIRKLKKGQAE